MALNALNVCYHREREGARSSLGPLGYFMDMRGQTTPEVGFYSMINKAKMHLKGNNLDLWGTLWTGVDKLPQRSLFAEVAFCRRYSWFKK